MQTHLCQLQLVAQRVYLPLVGVVGGSTGVLLTICTRRIIFCTAGGHAVEEVRACEVAERDEPTPIAVLLGVRELACRAGAGESGFRAPAQRRGLGQGERRSSMAPA